MTDPTPDNKTLAMGPGTPLPMTAHQYTGMGDSYFIRDAAGEVITGRLGRLSRERAAYIVRACNSFPALIGA